MTKSEHEVCVETWIEEQAQGLTAAQLAALFERAIRVLWQRTERTLGDVTLRAIADRVLHAAPAGTPAHTQLRLEPEGVGLTGNVGTPEELTEVMRFFLVEFLTVLGNLTADILTPALHRELQGVVAGSTARRPAKPWSRKIDEEKA
jgi:hypothetical protein